MTIPSIAPIPSSSPSLNGDLLSLVDRLVTMTGREADKIAMSRNLIKGRSLRQYIRLLSKRFKQADAEALFTFHSVLWKLYSLEVTIPLPGACNAESSIELVRIRDTFERLFLDSEDRFIPKDTLTGMPTKGAAYCA
jgi:hypothetical protein